MICTQNGTGVLKGLTGAPQNADRFYFSPPPPFRSSVRGQWLTDYTKQATNKYAPPSRPLSPPPLVIATRINNAVIDCRRPCIFSAVNVAPKTPGTGPGKDGKLEVEHIGSKAGNLPADVTVTTQSSAGGAPPPPPPATAGGKAGEGGARHR